MIPSWSTADDAAVVAVVFATLICVYLWRQAMTPRNTPAEAIAAAREGVVVGLGETPDGEYLAVRTTTEGAEDAAARVARFVDVTLCTFAAGGLFGSTLVVDHAAYRGVGTAGRAPGGSGVSDAG